jgi:LuxR family maltose regulon positive regulatory protein
LPVAWLSISAEDNNIERFLRYLLAAWEEAQPDMIESQLGPLLSAREPNSETVLLTGINVASDMSDHMVFVLDDYHLIEDASILHALSFLLDHLPPTATN